MFALTPRLTLRPGWGEDAIALAGAIGHETVVRNLAHVPWPYAAGDAEAFLAMPAGPESIHLLICERFGDYRLIGGIGLVRDGPAHELGYWLAPHAWGRGYATEAGRAVIAMARDTLRYRRLIARPFADNPASARVLARLGFRETGRGVMHSVARGGSGECLEMELALGDEDDRPLPMAA